MKSNPLVSVVMPTYDRPESIRRSIESVSRQTYTPIELIVVDDHSPTPAREILSECDPAVSRFELFRHDCNRGASAARNTGIKAATGEYIAFLDDDDEWCPEKIEKQVIAFDQVSEDVGLIYTGVRQVNARGQTNAIVTRRIGGDVTKRLLCWNFVGTFSVAMIRREVVNRVGLLDERFPSWQDWEFYLRISRQYQFGAIPEPLVIRHNQGEGQISQNYERKRETTVPLFESKYLPLAAEFGWIHHKKVRAHLQYQLAQSAIRADNYDQARQHLLQAVYLYPVNTRFYVELLAIVGGERTYLPLQGLKRRLARI